MKKKTSEKLHEFKGFFFWEILPPTSNTDI